MESDKTSYEGGLAMKVPIVLQSGVFLNCDFSRIPEPHRVGYGRVVAFCALLNQQPCFYVASVCSSKKFIIKQRLATTIIGVTDKKAKFSVL
jgi:hypothetical protein